MKQNFTWQPLAALQDNYIWAAAVPKAVIVDPGDAAPVSEWLAANDLELAAILITHSCYDHTGGVAQLQQQWPQAQTIAAAGEYSGHADLTAKPGDRIAVADTGMSLDALGTPGHTSGHLTYVGAGFALCGDALFSCGCGRLAGSSRDLLQSMEVFRALPAETLICCGHEYTAANVRFALTVDPDNAALREFADKIDKLRAAGQPTVPTTIEHELATNPFLRYDVATVAKAAQEHEGRPLSDHESVLAALRSWKDIF